VQVVMNRGDGEVSFLTNGILYQPVLAGPRQAAGPASGPRVWRMTWGRRQSHICNYASFGLDHIAEH